MNNVANAAMSSAQIGSVTVVVMTNFHVSCCMGVLQRVLVWLLVLLPEGRWPMKKGIAAGHAGVQAVALPRISSYVVTFRSAVNIL